jgi:hypothetical protein
MDAAVDEAQYERVRGERHPAEAVAAAAHAK